MSVAVTVRICPNVDDCPADDIAGNFSSEAGDTLDFPRRRFFPIPPPLGKQWNRTLCGVTFISTISQFDADLQAAASGLSCPPCDGPECVPTPGIQTFCNNPQTCCVPCPDGTETCYTIPGGFLCGFASQQAADGAAHTLACNLIAANKICISPLAGCMCINDNFSKTINAGGVPVHWSIVGGSLPPGLNFSGGFGATATISGTALVSGTYTFQIKASSIDSVFQVKTFSLTVLEITTASITGYTVGVPYSFQLVVSGGSGNYSWAIKSGGLPDGLTMSASGLISGTPTASNGINPMTFSVVDLTCEAAQQSVFPPRATLTTKSTTQIATVLGYPEFISSTPPKKYHKLTWSAASDPTQPGVSEQHATIFNSPTNVGGAKFVWSGSGEIDTHGNQISNYTKDYFAQCPLPPFPGIGQLPQIGETIGIPPFNIAFGVQGYCWPTDPASCPVCDLTMPFVQNVARNSGADVTTFLDDPSIGHVTTPTSASNHSAANFIVAFLWAPPAVKPADFPLTTTNGITAAWVHVTSTSDYMAVLSNEYTDAEALTNATVITSNGSTAENKPRTTGYVSRFTNVVYTIHMSNLIIGKSYVVTAKFHDQNFTQSTKQYGVVASQTTASITDVISTPPAGDTLTITGVTIAFLP